MNFNSVKTTDPEIYEVIRREIYRQRYHLELIASENFTSPAVLQVQGCPLTNKYAEGYPGARWYGGCRYVDQAEELARNRVCALFGAESANVQPHSGTQANMAVMVAMLQKGDTILAMDLACGGHLSHGHPLNFSGKFYHVAAYGVDPTTEVLDYDKIAELAFQHKPKLIVAGASAYPRVIDFARFRAIADKVGAYLMVDMAHFAGLVAAGIHPNPCPYAEFVTATTHKTLRGPRGGFVLSQRRFAKKINVALFPGIQGGPLMHTIAAKAVAFKEASTDSFKEYQRHVVTNARIFAVELADRKLRIVSGGTDTHLLLVDLRSIGVSGKVAQDVLEQINITINKNLIPYDPHPAAVTSGIRIGTPAITTRGMKEEHIRTIAEIIYTCLTQKDNTEVLERLKQEVKSLAEKFPLYPEVEI